MKKVFLSLVLGTALFAANAQVKKTSTATVVFDATTPKDDWPKATNNTVQAAMNPKNGMLEFKMKLENFSFKENNAKIKEHWLDPKCMDGAKFPEAMFKGKVVNAKAINLKADGTYKAEIAGKMTIHGVTKDVKIPATFIVAGGVVTANAEFDIASVDYGVSHPGEGAGKVSKTPKLSVTAEFK
jgi:polyisoprenoid-binding protein YceI